MSVRFKQVRTPRLDGLGGAELARAAETVRREHERAIDELRARVRGVESAPRMVGICALSLSASQAGLASGSVVAFDTEDANSVPSLVSSSSGRVRLAPGYTYKLLATVALSTGGNDTMAPRWYDVRQGAYVGQAANVYDPGATGSTSSQPCARYVVSPTGFVELECRAFTAVGSPNVDSAYSFASVEVFQ